MLCYTKLTHIDAPFLSKDGELFASATVDKSTIISL